MSTPPDALQQALADRYRIINAAGRGGMATVYLAEDLRHGRRVAVKVLDPEVARAVGPERFLREIRLTASLRHPHILPLYDSGEAAGFLYYVMPYVEGESLHDRLAREGPLPVPDAVRLLGEVAAALAYAHEHGVLHRDVKPANILLEGGRALLTDFGIARAARAAADGAVTQTGTFLGTPAYTSPEQAAGDARVDERTDVYALGCVLYEALVGRPPFSGPSVESVLYQHATAALPSARSVRREVPAALDGVIARALAKLPADRYANVDAMRLALAAATAEDAVPTLALPKRRTSGLRRFGAGLVSLPRLVAIVVGAGLLVTLVATQRIACPGSTSAIRSLAVLPLANLSGDPGQDYFVDGMTEELIGTLAQITGLRIISRTSVMGFKDTRTPLPEIARRLHVDALVEGAVRRDASHVVVDAHLVQASPERSLWGDRYERPLRDVLALQADIAQAITRAIRLEISADDRKRLARARPVDPDAHEAFLKGRFEVERLSQDGYLRAIQDFQDAIKIDPQYAPAWNGLAETYYYMSNVYLPPAQAIPMSRQAVERALALDPNLAEAHASLGVIRAQYDWDWAAAEAEFRRSIALNPNLAPARLFYATMLGELGRSGEAEAEFARAEQLDPLSEYIATVWLQPRYFSGRYDELIARCRQITLTDPTYAPAWTLLGLCHVNQGHLGDGMREIEKGADLSDNPFPLSMLSYTYARLGRRGDAVRALRRLESLADSSHVSAYSFAVVYAALGDRDRAFAFLERSYRARDEDLVPIKVDPALANLRDDPRFHDLLRRMRLES